MGNYACQVNTFLKIEFIRRLIEIEHAGLFYSIYSGSPFDQIQINLIHPLLRHQVLILYQPNNKSLLYLPGHSFISCEKHIFYKLHGKCTSTTGETVFLNICDDGFTKGFGIKPVVKEKTTIFRGHYRSPEKRRYIIKRHKPRIIRTHHEG